MNAEQWEFLLRLVEVLFLPFGAWVVKTLTAIQKEVVELKTVLIGVDGKNGIRSRVVYVERQVQRLAVRVGIKHDEDDDV